MTFLIRLTLNSLGIFAVSYVIPGFHVSGFLAALLFAVVLGVVNALIRPLVLLLTLPINILTLGFFTLIINALLFWLASSLSFGVSIDSFSASFLGAILVWVLSAITNWIFKDKYEEDEA